MSKEEEQKIKFAYITSLVMELYYNLDDELFVNNPLYNNGIKGFSQSLHRAIQAKISDRYFGVVKNKHIYKEATPEEQINLFDNLETIKAYHKSALCMTDEDRLQVQSILTKYAKV